MKLPSVSSQSLCHTVEPLNNGHIGTDHFVHYIKRLSSFRGKNVSTIYMYIYVESVLYTEVPFIQSVGSTVLVQI